MAGGDLRDLAFACKPDDLSLLHRPMVDGSGAGVEGEVAGQ